MGECSGNYHVGVVPVAFDIVSTGSRLAVNTAADIDQQINKVLESQQFQDALKKAVRDYNDKNFFDTLKGSTKTPEQNERDKLNAILKAAKTAGGNVIKSSVMETPTGQQLKQEMQAFKNEFDCSPTGVWLSENRTKLIVVGALGIIGGSLYMYKNRTGDSLASLSTSLLKKTFVVGSVNLDTKVTQLKPSTHELGVDLAASTKWRTVETKVAISLLAKENVADISTSGTITLPLAGNMVAGLGISHSNKNIPAPGVVPGTSQEEISAFIKWHSLKDKVSLQLNASAGNNGKYVVGAIFHLDF